MFQILAMVQWYNVSKSVVKSTFTIEIPHEPETLGETSGLSNAPRARALFTPPQLNGLLTHSPSSPRFSP